MATASLPSVPESMYAGLDPADRKIIRAALATHEASLARRIKAESNDAIRQIVADMHSRVLIIMSNLDKLES